MKQVRTRSLLNMPHGLGTDIALISASCAVGLAALIYLLLIYPHHPCEEREGRSRFKANTICRGIDALNRLKNSSKDRARNAPRARFDL